MNLSVFRVNLGKFATLTMTNHIDITSFTNVWVVAVVAHVITHMPAPHAFSALCHTDADVEIVNVRGIGNIDGFTISLI